ncbi:hypothetical protein FQN57_002022 [Myotisia sp. PD_48]|nr:hypothetical protein FQN57_002022 [Myotisia sp. PD_48]
MSADSDSDSNLGFSISSYINKLVFCLTNHAFRGPGSYVSFNIPQRSQITGGKSGSCSPHSWQSGKAISEERRLRRYFKIQAMAEGGSSSRIAD